MLTLHASPPPVPAHPLVLTRDTREAEGPGPSPVVAARLSGWGVLGSLYSQAGRPLSPSSSTPGSLVPPKFQRALLPESGSLSPPLIIKRRGLAWRGHGDHTGHLSYHPTSQADPCPMQAWATGSETKTQGWKALGQGGGGRGEGKLDSSWFPEATSRKSGMDT